MPIVMVLSASAMAATDTGRVIAPGTFVAGTLFTGGFVPLVPNGGTSPFIITLHGRMSGCVAVASGYADKDSERVQMKIVDIRCGEDDVTREGWVVGVDGRAGVKGHVVSACEHIPALNALTEEEKYGAEARVLSDENIRLVFGFDL